MKKPHVKLVLTLSVLRHRLGSSGEGESRGTEHRSCCKGLGGGLVLPVSGTDGKSKMRERGLPRFPAGLWLSPALSNRPKALSTCIKPKLLCVATSTQRGFQPRLSPSLLTPSSVTAPGLFLPCSLQSLKWQTYLLGSSTTSCLLLPQTGVGMLCSLLSPQCSECT